MDALEPLLLTLPAYALVDAAGVWPLRFAHGPEEIWLPLFTDRPGLFEFLERVGPVRCYIVTLPDRAAILAHFRRMFDLVESDGRRPLVILDPAYFGDESRQYISLTWEQLAAMTLAPPDTDAPPV